MFAKFFKNLFRIDSFYKNNKDIAISNAKILVKLCFASIILMTSYLFVLIYISKNLYFISIVSLFILVFILTLFSLYRIRINNFSNIKAINFITYFYIISAYTISILISFFSTKYPATMFPIMLVALPLLLIIQLKVSFFLSSLFATAYLLLSYFFKTDVFIIDLLNCLCVMFLNFLIGRFFSNTRKSEFILRDKYKHLSGIDELTELSNRRQFNINFEKTFYKSLNEKKTLALFLMDVDDFKKYNDTYGHLGGDDCLKKIGRFLKQFSEINPTITFYRYGGEEFIGIVNNIDRFTATKIARELVEGIKGLNIKHTASAIADIITISVGVVVQYPSVMPNSSELINLADKALYKVKENGKNNFLFF